MDSSETERKIYLLNLIGNVFSIKLTDDSKEIMSSDDSFSKFFDDESCFVLWISQLNGSFITGNQVSDIKDKKYSEKILIFLKKDETKLTTDNIKSAVLTMTLNGSSGSSFYYALKHLYIPLLLNEYQEKQPELPKMLKSLESRLKCVLNFSPEERGCSVIANVPEEISYWQTIAESSKSEQQKTQANEFFCILKSIEHDFRHDQTLLRWKYGFSDTQTILIKSATINGDTLSSMSCGLAVDMDEVIDGSVSTLNELWKASSCSYPQERMRRLIEVIGNNIVLYFQNKLEEGNVWKNDFNTVIDGLESGISACTKWNNAVCQLCTMDWSSSSERSWSGKPPIHELCSLFSCRLSEIKDIRLAHRQLTRLLSSSEQKELETNLSFSHFKNVKPGICSPYTEPKWQSAVFLFQKSLVPAENRVAIKLKNQLRHLKANTLQLLQELKRYKELIKRPNIMALLVAERENLLVLLQQYLNTINVQEQPDNAPLDLPSVVEKIYWTRQLKSKIRDIQNVNKELFNDLSGFVGLEKTCTSLLIQLQQVESERYDQWVREINKEIKNGKLTLSDEKRVLQLTPSKMTEVNYNPRLVKLICEVQLLSTTGLQIPAKVRELSERARKFIGQARSLEQIANFHNTIGNRIIPSQRPMLLPVAQELDKLTNLQGSVKWSDTEAVNEYVIKLQNMIDRLSKESNKLAFYHNYIRDKVIQLMSNSNIIHNDNFWKRGLKDIRETISHLESDGILHTESWKFHWDYQLYKALEWQYRFSLCELHSHFPEFKVELVYRQRKLFFQPPVEEIRLKYYSQVKRFLSMPLSFRGLSDGVNTLFATIIPRNAIHFCAIFTEAEHLFQQLEKLRLKWHKWVSFGGINFDKLAEENLQDADDWDWNFRASKNLAQEMAKLQFNDVKIGCLHVSVTPIRSEMEFHNRQYWDVLVTSLHSSILQDISHFDSYIKKASQILNAHPKVMSEIRNNHQKHAQLVAESSEMLKALESTVRKNKILASWTKEKVKEVNALLLEWENFQTGLVNYESFIGRQMESMKAALAGEMENLMSEIEKFSIRWQQQRPKETDFEDEYSYKLKNSLKLVREKNEEWSDFKLRQEKILKNYEELDMQKPDLNLFMEIETDLKHWIVVSTLYDDFHFDLQNLTKEEWIFFRNKLHKIDEFISHWEKKIEEYGTDVVAVRMLREMNDYKVLIPFLKYVRGEMFSDKHWLEVFSLLKMTNKSPESLTLGDFLAVKENIINSDKELQEINARAAGEITIRQALNELEAWEVQARFTLTQHTDSKNQTVVLIKDFYDVLNKVGDNQCLLQSILNSANSKNFVDRTGVWETKLFNLEACLRNLNNVQRKWVYLEPIFGSGILAMEESRFERIDQDFRFIMAEVAKDSHVMALIRMASINQTLTLLLDQLGRCQKSLNDYLQKKRFNFPKFYFLGDDDLLELVGQSTKEKVIQAHLKKLFIGVNSVEIIDGEIRSVRSLHSEEVRLLSPVRTTSNIEEWLSALDKEIKKTLKLLVLKYVNEDTMRDEDWKILPSQVLCLVESLWYTKQCEEHILKAKLQTLLKSLREKLDYYTRVASQSSLEDPVLDIKLKALILDLIHYINVTETLLERNVTSLNDWHWQKQLRYYAPPDGTIVVRMLDSELEYSYEYQGTYPKLVRTELTEKCFLTLTQALKMGLGGNPYGPAGTGKTESVKALGSLLGRQVLVFNCDEGIDIKSLSRILTGLVKCGAWGCFDEFNRLEETTLSAASMLIQPIQASLRSRKQTVKIFEEEVEMNWNCGIFVTLNPAAKDYAGRQKLPDNLKQLFRPVIMSVPDGELIAYVGLYCEGFQNAKAIGKKLVEVFDLARSLLSKRQHYDWGLRALKTVLGTCGNLFKKARKENKSDNIPEMELAVEAIRFCTLSKLTHADSILFDQVVRDVFLGVNFVNYEFQQLTDALRTSAKELGLEISEYQVKKCIEVYEQMQQRMGVALVGPSGVGKTTIVQILKHGLEKIGRNVKQYVMNPKSMPRSQLLGRIDLDTRQWSEGVLTSSVLKLHSEFSDFWSWLICDGDIDPDWVEALNSVLDDNRLLTLPSGWRIQFGPNFNFIFETSSLSNASPATISRMGIIFLSDESVNMSLTMTSWLRHQDDLSRQFLEPYVSNHFYKCIEWIREKGEIAVPFSTVALVKNCLGHLAGVKSKSHFAISLVYGLGGNLTYASRQLFAQYVFQCMAEFIPDPSQILNCYFNKEREKIDVFLPGHVIYDSNTEFPPILTASTQTSMNVLQPWINSYEPVLINGPKGSGKNLLLRYCLSKLPATEVVIIYCSSLTTPQHVLQKLKYLCSESLGSSGRVLKPKNAQKLVLYFKNLEKATPDKWGTNMLMSWLQQIIGYNGFYDTDLEWIKVERIQVIATLTDSDCIPSQRLTSIMRIYHLSSPDERDLMEIYKYYVKFILENHFGNFKALSTPSSITSLASTLVTTYQEVQKSFPQISYKTCYFTPRCLTQWCTGLRRYSIDAENPIRSLLTAVVYEAFRLFCDRLITEGDRSKMRNILVSVMESEWNQGDIVDLATEIYFVPHGDCKTLTQLSAKDWSEMVEKGVLKAFGNESDVIVIDELVKLTAFINRSLSLEKKSLTLCGKSGVGRKTALKIVSAEQGSRLISLYMPHDYSTKNFKMDLKSAFQVAGIEGEPVYLVIEGYQIINDTVMNMINSVICSGEVPGLYNPEELESIILQLSDMRAQDGVPGSTASYFAERVLKNLHVVLVLDSNESYFPEMCENNPEIYTNCDVIWASEWSLSTMKIISTTLFSKVPDFEDILAAEGCDNLSSILADIHNEFKEKLATPRRYLFFVRLYIRLYVSKKGDYLKRTNGLKGGVLKLTEAKTVVDNLKQEANKQEESLADKQFKAASALNLIGETMKNANVHKEKMERLKEKTASENKILLERKKVIDKELAEVEPLIKEARQAVGNIKNESLSEIRSLRAPPDVIRDILEGVLRLMGIQDTSWNSMKTFLAKRGIKEEIKTFDVKGILMESVEAVESLLMEKSDSFDPKVAKRASVAAAPLAAWVKANIAYAKVLQKIRPLQKEQIDLERNLKDTEEQMEKLSTGLSDVDEKVTELKHQLNTYSKEAAIVEIKLTQAKDTIVSAQELVTKLDDEYKRWKSQMAVFSQHLKILPQSVLLASAYIIYLASSEEEIRLKKISEWKKKFGLTSFSITDFVFTERDKLKWLSEGLMSDLLSLENAAILLETNLSPFLIDPNGEGVQWLKKHFADSNLEVVSQNNTKLQTILELAVRFGKVLIIEDVNEMLPILMPILRKSVMNQGQRQIIYVGERLVDYHKDFKLFLVTRNSDFDVPSDVMAISFSITQKGLARQLLSSALQQERPQLDLRKTEIVKEQEEMKSKLYQLQEILLTELASAQGDILQNKNLLHSLNETKSSSEKIIKALSESKNLETELDKECEIFKPISEFASYVYFSISCMSKLSVMNQFSVYAFKKLFQKTLKSAVASDSNLESQKQALIKMVFNYVSRSLFKADRLTFALHLAHHMSDEKAQPMEWKVFTGEAISESKTAREPLPKWVDVDREFDIRVLRSALPQLFEALKLSDNEEWSKFAVSGYCEKELPKSLLERLTAFEVLLVIQAFRPDRLLSCMTEFSLKTLHLESLSPSSMKLSTILEESVNVEPILLIVGPGADPSEELRILAKTTRGMDLHEVALGQGQTTFAIEKLKYCAKTGEWLCLKNLHLMTSWLNELEKELRSMKLSDHFRLWLTTEPHDHFSPVLANSCLKIVYEAPAGIKKNLQRTYGSWTSEMFLQKGVLFGRTMFAAAWLHAVLQERRNYIPQGWTKFYEITDADLNATLDLVRRSFQCGIINWEFIHGVLLNTIYGGRIENNFDAQVLSAYVREFFKEAVLNKGRGFGPDLTLPSSESYPEYLELIHHLNNFDKPSDFGLPENVERTWQKIRSSQVISSLKALHHPERGNNFDLKSWQKHLSPILNLWKKLNEGIDFAKERSSNSNSKSCSNDPLILFFEKDFHCGLQIIQLVHKAFARISKVIRGINLPDQDLMKVVRELLCHQTPFEWQHIWEGPENPMKYIRSIIYKTLKVQKCYVQKESDAVLEKGIDLSDFLRPEMFLNAMKQLTGRKLGIPLDELNLVNNWNGFSKNGIVSFQIKNLQIEGAIYNGRFFNHTTVESPSVTTAPPVYLAYVKKTLNVEENKKKVIFPVYRSSERDREILHLVVPCIGELDDWLKAGPAFFLRYCES